MDLMVSMFLMPVMVTPCRCASVTSVPLALLFKLLAVVCITRTSRDMESRMVSPSFQLYIISSAPLMRDCTTKTSPIENWTIVCVMVEMLE